MTYHSWIIKHYFQKNGVVYWKTNLNEMQLNMKLELKLQQIYINVENVKKVCVRIINYKQEVLMKQKLYLLHVYNVIEDGENKNI